MLARTLTQAKAPVMLGDLTETERIVRMFKLQRLEITGFKSFADYTEIVFTGDGITAVVGPNGCGKSNVADAIAWVLGEQRVKHLRGAEMKDVIFQGSRNRQPSGMAEVVLHLVRDEMVEHEPDIEDIDSTLEQIDEHAVSFAEAADEEPEPQTFAANEAIDNPVDNPVDVGADSQAEETEAAVPTRSSKGQHHTSGIGGAEISRWSLRPAKRFQLRAASIAQARASTCSTISFAGCVTFRICFPAPDFPVVTTRSSSRAASVKFFPPSRWTVARSSKRRRASRSFACASARRKRDWNRRVRICPDFPTSFLKSSGR